MDWYRVSVTSVLLKATSILKCIVGCVYHSIHRLCPLTLLLKLGWEMYRWKTGDADWESFLLL